MPNGSGGVGSLMPSCPNRCSAPIRPHKIPQASFCVAGFAKASPNQLLDPLLCGRSCHRSNARVPPRFDFDIRRQTSDVDKAPGIYDGPFVEGGDSGGKRLDESVKVSIRKQPIDVAIELGQDAWDIA